MAIRCHQCGYDLTSLRRSPVSHCPECGVGIDFSRRRRPGRDRAFWLQLAALIGSFVLLVAAAFVPGLLPDSWLAHPPDPFMVAVVVFYSPGLLVGVVSSLLGLVLRQGKVPKPRAYATWAIALLITAGYLWFTGATLWYFFVP
ncbi:MAG: zinc ribbon domain-containing protein [Phycisphaeraceae bacterium]|nr:MAG: zinc ribbon domain-containing protein [Phycisphaeraceae bacterium]